MQIPPRPDGRSVSPSPFAKLYPRAAAAEASRNELLRSLDSSVLDELRPHLETTRLQEHDLLFATASAITNVYFPESAVVSLVTSLERNRFVVGTIGNEGMVGLSAFLDVPTSFAQTIVVVDGVAQRMSAVTFRRLAQKPGRLHRLMLRYTQAFLAQVSHNGACNTAHVVTQRCARWLLNTGERVDADEFPLSVELMAMIVGAGSGGVTLSLRALQDNGCIRYSHGRILIVDHEGLRGASCDCYESQRAQHAQLIAS